MVSLPLIHLVKTVKSHPLFKCIGIGVLLLGILFLAFWIRVQGVERFPDGQFSENDAYLFHWQAKEIAEQGYLSARDKHRWLPMGRDNQQMLSLYPYVITSTYKAIGWMSPKLTLYRIQLYMPTICFTLGLGVLFLFLAHSYGIVFATISTVLLATLPGSIERSAAGFGDRDAWCWLFGVLAVTSYLWKEQIPLNSPVKAGKNWRRHLATALAGFTVFLGGLSWEGFGFFVLIIVAAELWKFCTTDIEHSLKEYALWILMFVPGLYILSPVYRGGYGFSTHVAALMLLPPLTVFVLRGMRHLLLKYVENLRPHARKLAWGLTLLAIIAGLSYLFLQSSIFETTAFALRESRLMKDVGELVDPHFGYWPARYGAVFILGGIGLIGASLHLWRWEGLPLTLTLVLFTTTTFFRWPISKWIGANVCDTLFFTALVIIPIAIGIACLRQETAKNELLTLAMLAWFFLWVGLARGGKRYDFFIGIPLAYGTAWLLWLSPAHLIQKLKDAKFLYPHVKARRIAATTVIVVLIPILFWNPLGGHATRSIHAAAEMQQPSLGEEGSLAQTLTWMKDTLPKNAVVAANWGYGTQLNVFGGVKTITDSDHFLPHWIHLYYRHVFCAQSEQEALSFLKTHGATHLMLTKWGVTSQSKNFSFIGSTASNDRRFRFYELTRREAPVGAPYQIRPKQHGTPVAFVDMVSTTPVRSPGAHAHIVPGTQQKLGVTAHLKTHRNIFHEISINTDSPSQQAVGIGNGGVVFYFDSRAIFDKAYYVPPIGWNSLAVKLFLRGKHRNAFIPVYPENGDAAAEVKVWEIHYPPYIKKNSKYLRTEPKRTDEK